MSISRRPAIASSPRSTGGHRNWHNGGSLPPSSPRTSSAAPASKLLKQLKIPGSERGWIRALRGKDIHNAALVALDYRTGDVLAYIGSAGYDRDKLASKRFEPKYDVAGDGYRQPGSAFKPIIYATAFEERDLTPGSLLLDITTEFNAGSKLGAARRRPTGPRAGPGPRGAPAIAEHPGDPGARAGRQQGRRQAGRGDGHPIPGRREAVSPGRPGRRARHGRGHTARPDVRFWHPRQWWRPRPAADDPRGPRVPTARWSGRRRNPMARRRCREGPRS